VSVCVCVCVCMCGGGGDPGQIHPDAYWIEGWVGTRVLNAAAGLTQ
jgi:hypothetical protein